eukprot:4409839-Prymnesium_polylepis.1
MGVKVNGISFVLVRCGGQRRAHFWRCALHLLAGEVMGVHVYHAVVHALTTDAHGGLSCFPPLFERVSWEGTPWSNVRVRPEGGLSGRKAARCVSCSYGAVCIVTSYVCVSARAPVGASAVPSRPCPTPTYSYLYYLVLVRGAMCLSGFGGFTGSLTPVTHYLLKII